MPQETTWEKTAPSQIVLNSIFAALDGALIVIIIQDQQQPTWWQFWSLILLVVSFCLFAVSAEKCVVALDEHDVRKYAYYMLPYNLGVISAGVAVEFVTYVRFGSKVRDWMALHLGVCSGWVWFLAAIIFMWTWLRDSCWLLGASKKDYDEWLEELEDKRSPAPEPGHLMNGFYRLRRILHG